jgi:hypothetical protein
MTAHQLKRDQGGYHLFMQLDLGTTGDACRWFCLGSVATGEQAMPYGDHFYTTSLLERDGAIAKSGYQSEDIACFVFTGQMPGTAPLHRLVHRSHGFRFYTASDVERDNAVANLDYRSEGEACFAFPERAEGTVPLHRLVDPRTGKHFYTVSDLEMDDAISQRGFTSEADACFVFPGDPSGLTPLYRLLRYTPPHKVWLPPQHRPTGTATQPAPPFYFEPPMFIWTQEQGNRDHFYTTSLAERDSALLHHGYLSEDVACVVHPAQAPETIPFHRVHQADLRFHFYTASDMERDNAVANLGYISEGDACFVFPAQAAGTVPLHRLRDYLGYYEYAPNLPMRGGHFYTTSDRERDNAVAQLGFTNEGEACFVFPSSPSGVVPLYRLLRVSG